MKIGVGFHTNTGRYG